MQCSIDLIAASRDSSYFALRNRESARDSAACRVKVSLRRFRDGWIGCAYSYVLLK